MIKRYKYSLLLSLVILYLSLKSADELNNVPFLNIPHFDKIAHLCMYFAFMSVVILETGKAAVKLRSLMFIAILPFFYGILMEVLQSTLTLTRYGSLNDVIFNTLGILLAILLRKVILYVYSKDSDSN
jgi:VanZ family protein